MISVTLLGKTGRQLYLNPHLIETIENLPDTTITLTNGKVFVVQDSFDVIFKKIIEYRRRIGLNGNEE
jgi:flagellar protein FlbD